jgi:hypothetical protein
MVRYHLQPGTFGILLLVARGPADKVRVVPLGKTDGSAEDWMSMSARDRTARAEQLFHDEAQVVHRES